jgi:hypothetical protein
MPKMEHLVNPGGRGSVSAVVFRAQAWTLSIGMGRGFAPQESDDTEVVPP